MKSFLLKTLLAVTFLAANFQALWAESSSSETDRAAGVLKQAVQERSFYEEATLTEWKQVATKAEESLPEDHHGRKLLAQLSSQAADWQDNEENRSTFRERLREVHESITFQFVAEAPVPEGFPEITPVNVIQIKEYPEYRMARVKMAANENGAFWKLFNHIKRSEIAMTAPVEMGYQTKLPKLNESEMAFLYRTTEQGETGLDVADQKVEVLDVPPSLYVSIGCRGRRNQESMTNAADKLREWVEVHQDEYQITGPLRALGYNSPFIPSFRQYYEVQFPVERVN